MTVLVIVIAQKESGHASERAGNDSTGANGRSGHVRSGALIRGPIAQHLFNLSS